MRLLLVLLLCFSSFAQADDTVFRARLIEDPGTLDWNQGETKGEILYQLMEGLFRTDKMGQPIAGVAKEWDWNKHKTELKIKLRPKLRWSDGKELCASDFIRSWRRLQDKKFASPYAHYAASFQSFSSSGCYEIRIRTRRYAPELPALLAHWVFFPLREEHLYKNADAFKTGKNLLVNGPFLIKEWVRDQRLVLERNPKYAQEQGRSPIQLDRIEFLFVPEDATALALYEQGKLDWMRDVNPLLRLEKFKLSGELKVFPALIAFYFGLNRSKSKLLENIEVRQALSQALHREELSSVLGAEVRPAHRWLPPEVLERKLDTPPRINEVLLKKVQELLLTAVKDGRMDLRLRVYSKPIHKQLAEWAQGQWQKYLGINIPVEVVEEKVYWNEIATNTPPIFLSGVTAPFNHPRAFLQEFFKGSSANWLGWGSETYDLAVDDQKYVRAEDILLDSAQVIPLYTRGNVALLAKQWQGFLINPLGVVYLADVRK